MIRTPEDIATAVEGRLVRHAKSWKGFRGVAIDTREIEPGQVFFAFKGDNADGHRFVAHAARAGSPLAIVTDEPAATIADPDIGLILADDCERAIANLARTHRSSLINTRVIAITGSAGKTTTTRLLGQILADHLRGTCARKSHNNRLGISLTILNARPDDEYLICEVGTNSPGEIDEYGALVRPHIGVVTCLGREHLEGFGDLEGVADEAAALFPHTTDRLILHHDPRLLARAPDSVPRTTFSADPGADLTITDLDTTWDATTFNLNNHPFRVPIPGAHNALNAAAVIAVARELGIPDNAIADSLARAAGPELRLERIDIAGIRVLNDSYNAHPDSMIAAIDTAAAIDAPRRVAVLGDMLELGPDADTLHAEIGEHLAKTGAFAELFCLGPLSAHTAKAAAPHLPTHHDPEPSDDAFANIARSLSPGDLVLIKGSRGMRLERLVDHMQQAHAPSTI